MMAVVGVIQRLIKLSSGEAGYVDNSDDKFLLLWLVLEVAGYFLVSPFPAARRLLELTVVLVLVVGRLATRTCWVPSRQSLVHGIAISGAMLGLAYYAVDLREAQGPQRAVAAAGRFIAQQVDVDQPTVWYTGHWGFQFHAERAGMRCVIPDRSLLRAGDWLVVPGPRFSQQHIVMDNAHLEAIAEIEVGDRLPHRTIMCSYLGCVPPEHHEGARASVSVYRVGSDFTAATQH
jgi:hypothetical protein